MQWEKPQILVSPPSVSMTFPPNFNTQQTIGAHSAITPTKSQKGSWSVHV